MEKLAESKFGKFEGNEIENLKSIRGGDECTGGGSAYAGRDDETIFYHDWNGDSVNTSTGTITYYGASSSSINAGGYGYLYDQECPHEWG